MRSIGYRWHLRQLMATRGMYSTTDLDPLLRERGIELSATQVYRLVTGTPERLNLPVLAAICDALGCQVGDLIEPHVISTATRRRKASGAGPEADPAGASSKRRPMRPVRATVVRPK